MEFFYIISISWFIYFLSLMFLFYLVFPTFLTRLDYLIYHPLCLTNLIPPLSSILEQHMPFSTWTVLAALLWIFFSWNSQKVNVNFKVIIMPSFCTSLNAFPGFHSKIILICFLDNCLSFTFHIIKRFHTFINYITVYKCLCICLFTDIYIYICI